MGADSKLAAVLTSFEVAERSALLEFRRIEKVAEERNSVLQVLRREHEALAERVRNLLGERTHRALLQGDTTQLFAVRRYEQQLAKALVELDKEIQSQTEEVRRADERTKLAEQDLIAARIEKKKVEQLSANRRQLAQVREAAREEEKLDELNSYQRNK